MVYLSTKPPQFDWEFHRSDLETKLEKCPVQVYVNKLIQILEWSGSPLSPNQVSLIMNITKDCKKQLKKCTEKYTLVSKFLFPKFRNVDLWLDFFAPMAPYHLDEMWYLTPYIPKMPTQQLTQTETLNMLNNVAHLFRK